MSAAREAERRQEHKQRERVGTDARKAIQMARYWADQGNAQAAEAWAQRAVEDVGTFAVVLAAELKP